MKFRSIHLWLTICACISVGAVMAHNEDSLYVVSFTHKPDYNPQYVSGYVSQRALQHYEQAHITIGEDNAPISQVYIDSVLAISGGNMLTWSKWFNYIVIECASEYVSRIAACSFVYQVCPIHQYTPQHMLTAADTMDMPITPFTGEAAYRPEDMKDDSIYYGPMYMQIAMHNGQWLHSMGYKGQNMLIAVIDGGFLGMDTASYWESVRNNSMYALYDVTNDEGTMFSRQMHGACVTSIMSSNVPYVAVGTAPEASYAIIKTECNDYEYRLEEFFLVRGAEIADSIGADVVNISLGYTDFDAESESNEYSYLTGLHSPASVAVSRLMQKCTFVCAAAGNDGAKAWRYIGVPGDAKHTITVAAIKSDSTIAEFSSRGGLLSAPHKPDVAAIGDSCFYYNVTENNILYGNGTSFATPVMTGLMACLRQAFPSFSPMEIKQAVLQSSHIYTDGSTYSNEMGYGIPNMYKAYQLLEQAYLAVPAYSTTCEDIQVYPNPFAQVCYYTLPYECMVEVCDVQGSVVWQAKQNEGQHCLHTHTWAAGMYVLRVYTRSGIIEKKIVKQ